MAAFGSSGKSGGGVVASYRYLPGKAATLYLETENPNETNPFHSVCASNLFFLFFCSPCPFSSPPRRFSSAVHLAHIRHTIPTLITSNIMHAADTQFSYQTRCSVPAGPRATFWMPFLPILASGKTAPNPLTRARTHLPYITHITHDHHPPPHFAQDGNLHIRALHGMLSAHARYTTNTNTLFVTRSRQPASHSFHTLFTRTPEKGKHIFDVVKML